MRSRIGFEVMSGTIRDEDAPGYNQASPTSSMQKERCINLFDFALTIDGLLRR
jgi:hypothetical protein